MPIPLIYGPNVYVQELPNPVRPIVGVPTSVAAFVGVAPQGVIDYPFQVNSWADYENEFGSLSRDWPLSYAVYLFFLNGGTTALVVRNNDPTDTDNCSVASVTLDPGSTSSSGGASSSSSGGPSSSSSGGPSSSSSGGPSSSSSGPPSPITLYASSPGAWGTQLWATVDTDNLFHPDVQFNLTIRQVQTAPGSSTATVVSQEVYTGANLQKGSPQYLPTLLAASQLVSLLDPTGSGSQPTSGWVRPGLTKDLPGHGTVPGTGSVPGVNFAAHPQPAPAADAPPIPLGDPNKKTGIYALTKADIFNILCLPVDPASTWDPSEILGAAAEFCVHQRAMLVVDPPTDWAQVPLQFPTISGSPALTSPSSNAAMYYPNLVVTDETGTKFNVGPSGAVAGVWAATDSSRGVWKAPAGTAATITGVSGFVAPGHQPSDMAHLDDAESGTLNPLAVNALRTKPAVGPVVWGARTTVGSDQAQNQWKYLPVRRLALYIEESLRRGTQWAVFEPNDEPLWSSLRLNVGTFMQTLFSQGAFQGKTPADAYLVQCDANNNPQAQIDLGIVNILVGFAPLYPAEFVIISIQQQQPGQS
jgi:hypothetical protein